MTASIDRSAPWPSASTLTTRGTLRTGGDIALIPLHFGAKQEDHRSPPADMNRKIAAILAADVAGYSRLVAADEEAALRRLVEAQAVFKERIAVYRGRIFNTAGDAILAEFPSAVDATRAALDIQREMASRNADYAVNDRFLFRIGLNIGDVVEHEGDLLGDGVNIAARIQTLAPPGGLAISHWVREHVAGKVTTVFRDIGRQALKNIPTPVHVFIVDLAPLVSPAAKAGTLASVPLVSTVVKVVVGSALLLATGILVVTQFRTPASSPLTAPNAPATEATTKAPAPAVVPVRAEPTGVPSTIPTPVVPQVPTSGKMPDTLPAPSAPLSVPSLPPSAPKPEPPVAKSSIGAPPPPSSAPAKVEKDASADRKRTQQSCAEVLERAQLGDVTADDRAFLRNQCR